MQMTQKSVSAELVVNNVWNFFNHMRGNVSLDDMFVSMLACLYGYHKGYKPCITEDCGLGNNLFDATTDQLLDDLMVNGSDDRTYNRQLRDFLMSLQNIDRKEFNVVYPEVLKGLFERLCINSGAYRGIFLTPFSIIQLMAYFLQKEDCRTVYDPFCGTASLANVINDGANSVSYEGQELNLRTSLFARLTAEAQFGSDNCVRTGDSITQWSLSHFDAVATCPPFAVKLSDYQMEELRHSTNGYSCHTLDALVLTRPFEANDARLTVTLHAVGICFRGNRDRDLRRYLVDNNLLDTIVALPAGILYGTSIPSVLFVCKKNRGENAPIKIVHADNYVLGERRFKTFDFNRCVAMLDGDACDCVDVTREEIINNDYNLMPNLYFHDDFKLKDGQQVAKLGDLIEPIQGEKIETSNVEEVISRKLFFDDFIKVMLNKNECSEKVGKIKYASFRKVHPYGCKFLLVRSAIGENKYALYTKDEEFVCPSEINVYKVNESLVKPEYLLHLLLSNPVLCKGGMPLQGYLTHSLVIDSFDVQDAVVSKLIQQYEEQIRKEHEADAKRLGIKHQISDLEHMLGTTQLRINKIISRLEKSTPGAEKYSELVKSLKDNFGYMNRMIQYENAHIDSDTFNLKEGDILKFVEEYGDAWRNYGGEYFELLIRSEINNTPVISYDKTLLTVMLDSILSNAVRHGFKKDKRHTEHNEVTVALSEVQFKGKPFVRLSVANNGDMMPEGFDVKDYISRGRYSSSTGRSGLGGYHVYQIAKGHGGYLRLDSNKQWNVIVEVLLPIESANINDLTPYDDECI